MGHHVGASGGPWRSPVGWGRTGDVEGVWGGQVGGAGGPLGGRGVRGLGGGTPPCAEPALRGGGLVAGSQAQAPRGRRCRPPAPGPPPGPLLYPSSLQALAGLGGRGGGHGHPALGGRQGQGSPAAQRLHYALGSHFTIVSQLGKAPQHNYRKWACALARPSPRSRLPQHRTATQWGGLRANTPRTHPAQT